MIFMRKSIKLIAEVASYRKWSYSLIDYFSKRFFRVYPLFALLSITLWLMPFKYKNQYYLVKKPEDFNLFQTLTFHPEHRHYLLWTLPLEISYYFILPVFVLAVIKLERFWWMSFIPLYIWIIHEGLYTTRDNFYRQPLSMHLPTFVAGSMAAILFVKFDMYSKATGFKIRTPHVIGLRVVETALIAAYLSVVFRGLFFNWLGMPLPHDTRYIMPFTSVKLSLLIVVEMVQPSTVSEIFEWVVLRYLGKISFSVYLLHVFVIFTKPIKYQVNYYDRTFSIFGLVIMLATVSYHLVEYPSQLLAQRISRKLASLTPQEHEKVSEQSDIDSEEPDGRHLTQKSSFEWVLDPHAADRCENGSVGCVNHVKYGYTVLPVNVTTDAQLVMQSAERPPKLSAVVKLETFTQPGCVISGCHSVKLLGVLPQEDCFNQQTRKRANQPDGKSVKIDFGGIYYEHLPSGELYVKFERRNYLTDQDTCTFEVRSGYKRWF
ncbi:Acyltransferase family [Phytophthora palmivora]|uniref:Acyltransferase family n=1 Tax=Phytophthora palmivora TaxID=4796 RepID=A0A2P4YJ05_9STRA|nr:Acyltransferase family [Phytophthora palmivora]